MNNYLFVGDKNSGKSTLMYTLSKRTGFSCGGIISLPYFKDEKKYGADAIDVQTGERKVLTRLKQYADFYGETVGRYIISEEGIEHGKHAITSAVDICDFIIIDEFGPFELKGKGWAKEATHSFNRGNVIAVVRKSLQNKFFERYGRQFMVLTKDALIQMLH
jgi:nucleoside-triphosphatase THEP1